MPARIIPLGTDEIYHVFNRGINRQPTFTSRIEYQRAILAIKFYRLSSPPISLSKFLVQPKEKQEEILESMKDLAKLVDIICFCLMPNHFHFLLKQRLDGGISKFMGNFQNSYTRYHNTRNEKDGSIFLTQFKAVRISTDEQLLHVSRYIHLNPHTGYIVKSLNDLENYSWSSFKNYLKEKSDFIDTDLVLGLFKNSEYYKQFVFDQASYQRELKLIKHLIME